MEGLKACPFCGSTNVAISPYDGAKTVVCMDCLCMSAAYRGENAEANAIAAWNRRAAPENEALTLEQLRQMDGEPVFVASPGAEEYGHWVIVAGVDDTDGDKTLYCSGDFTCRDYGSVWLAYARKPEGSEKT